MAGVAARSDAQGMRNMIAIVALAACGGGARHSTAIPVAAPTQERSYPPRASQLASNLTPQGDDRFFLAFKLTKDSKAKKEAVAFFTGPPDATFLYVFTTAPCDEDTLAIVASYVADLRAYGFVRAACYPEAGVSFDVPPAGKEPVIFRARRP